MGLGEKETKGEKEAKTCKDPESFSITTTEQSQLSGRCWVENLLALIESAGALSAGADRALGIVCESWF